MINDEPTSLATLIPRRKRGGWDVNIANKRSKLDTVDAAIDIMTGSNENAHHTNFGHYRQISRRPPAKPARANVPHDIQMCCRPVVANIPSSVRQ